ncbi:hypothetical protein ES703_125554 [subsurface metagenome]
MSYVLAVITQFNTSGSDEVVIKARGRAISTAVDAAEITRNRFATDTEVKEIKIGTESITNEEGRTVLLQQVRSSLVVYFQRILRFHLFFFLLLFFLP